MKILYIDTAVDGHHKAYMCELINSGEWDSSIILPSKIDELKVEQYVYEPIDLQNKTLLSYMKWMKELSAIAELEQPDIVHFLMGDNFYKFFGLGLSLFKKFKTITTLHWVRPG